ncbi:MAG: amidase [Acidimicrobiia bacterium]|nr:amidase [Acidimicrobiia bacterium]
MQELGALDATACAELIRAGEVSPQEMVDAAIDRIERLDPDLNAVVHPLFEKARAAAADPALPDGPFAGVPMLLKDLTVETAGDPFTCGTRFLRALGWRSEETSWLASRFREAGFVNLGKTNVPEFGSVVTTEPVAFGPTRNPWNPDHSVGGSSGGSAAAVAARMVPVAHANDGGGSIRIPASECGLVGLKPSRGRVSQGPMISKEWDGFTIDGCVTRSVRDTAAVLDAISGLMPGDPCTAPPPRRPFADEVGADPGRLRIGSLTSSGPVEAQVHPDCAKAVASTLGTLEGLGHDIDADAHPELDDPEFSRFFLVIISAATARVVQHWAETTGQDYPDDLLEPHNLILSQTGQTFSALDWLTASEWLGSYTRRVASWWGDGWDILVTPTIAEPPPRLGEFTPTVENPGAALFRSASLIPFTPPFNVSGQPAVSLPRHWNEDGLPIGVQLVAAYGREDLLLQVAAQLEEAMPWAHRCPPGCG